MKRTSSLLNGVVLALLIGSPTANADGMQVERAEAVLGKFQSANVVAKTTAERDIYVVQLKGDPVIAYEGDIKGLAATKPGKGKKINPNSAHVKKYAAHLENNQDQVIQSVGGDKVYSYRYAINGFAARMTEAAAEALRSRDDVVNVWKDEILQLQTDTSPTYIGLTEAGDAWSKGYAGEDIVLGIIDSGIWPEHPSFADVATPLKGNKGAIKPFGAVPEGFSGTACDFGNTSANAGDAAFSCNNKLITAQCFNNGFSLGPDSSNPCGGDGFFTGSHDFQSTRDYDGHGSHTASTAGGNYGVPAYVGGDFVGNISGMAPRARIAAYKVCWDGPDMGSTADDGCASSDSAAAIDQAVLDGVDAINFSIGGGSNSFGGADDIAFLFAAVAGVHVATSNGNAGPGAGTVGTPSGVPWITAVGATQDNGVFNGAVRVNDPASIAGDYVALEGNSDVSLADSGPITGDVTMVSDFFACGPVDPIDGIALASRGGCSFSAKYNNAAAAGASAIIVFNDGADPTRIGPITMFAPGTSIPGVMISFTDGMVLAGETGVNATLDAENRVSADNRIAGFSSRGPNNGALDIIKPDLSAPGVQTLAAVSPAGGNGSMFGLYSGTSMASPHVAGSFALLKQAHPDWTPAMARSALMTTARQGMKKTFGDAAADPFDIGAGVIQTTDAMDPGLAYDAGLFDYAAFSCGNNVQIFSDGSCAFLQSLGFSFDGSALNLPSIGIAELVGVETVTRTVTAVYNNNGHKTFTVSVDAPQGIDVSVTPSSITLKKGESISFDVTFTVTDAAALNEWAFGSLTWTDTGGVYSVRSPIAVRPSLFSTPAEVDGTADANGNGSVSVPVQFGYSGDYSATVSGLAPGGSGAANMSSAVGTQAWCVNLPANSHFRTAMFDEDTSSPGNDDLDMELFYLPNGCGNFAGFVFVGGSYTPTTEEAVDLPNGPAGGYYVQVYYFSAANGTDSDYRIWFQPVFGDEGNAVVTAPGAAVVGASDVVTVDYNGLAPTRNLGVLHHADGGGEVSRTILDIDARP